MNENESKLLAMLLARTGKKPYVNVTGFDEETDIAPKQWYYYLTKWSDKGWFDYGVSARTGWFTPEGITHFTG